MYSGLLQVDLVVFLHSVVVISATHSEVPTYWAGFTAMAGQDRTSWNYFKMFSCLVNMQFRITSHV